MPQLSPPIAVDEQLVAGDRVIARVIGRLIPFLCLLYVVNYLDRTNVAMAKLQMARDTLIDDRTYGLGAGLFFIGYFLFEIPSNLILERVGARRWMARIMISWGIISAAMMFVRGPRSFYALRFLLGLAEAGFFPGIVLYLTYWIPQGRRAQVMSAFLTSTAISGVIGNPLAGALMKFDGVGSLHGWQWLFLLEGLLPVALGFVVLMLLPDRPDDAHWLDHQEKDWLDAELRRQGAASPHHVAHLREAFRDGRLWLLTAIYFMLVMGLYGFIYWVPSIVKGIASESSELAIGSLSAIPFLVAAIAMVLIGRSADRRDERRVHIALTALTAATGIVMVSLFTASRSTSLRGIGAIELALCIAAIGIWGALGPFWALATRFLRGSAAAGGIATVNSIGNLSGFVAPFVIGWVKASTGGFGGLLVVAAALVCGAGLVMCVPKAVDRSPR